MKKNNNIPLKAFALGVLFLSLSTMSFAQEKPEEVREYYVSSLIKIADPVLTALSKDQLKEKMPIERSPGAWDDRTHVTYLEAFGRLMSGMAPWLEIGPDDTEEGKLREKYIELSVKSLENAVDPDAKDFMNFSEDRQPLVDAAFLAQALLRAPNQLWGNLEEESKENVIEALKSTRKIKPYYSNWLLFTAMVEAALLKFDEEADMVRMDYALNKHMEWYLGDGMYGDGPNFHWDYYNSFVIQPMMLDILKTLNEEGIDKEKDLKEVTRRASRYAEIQERLISPEGTYPPIGRSLAYRFGAFQALSQIALWEELPEEIKPAQVRSALHAVIKKQIEAEGTFDEEGWLKVGFYGSQNNIGEGYISTGSLYLCSEAFLVLGLEEDNEFWSAPAAPWTQKKIWSGEAIPIDKAE
ncbi:hypothetical protein APR41_05725 [Salegentibacter salinarum]|uniref:DUF2264 domain-containing protein n=1 Tax=Salegentibacter salinarum TaxID=447422 RepID=A0A2N0TSK6_9FLAO|nr:DUF2264 domain-containing protein [Salegentibacter salinarum]PKD17705.1 hypothetical protein APR41_05725 [Salegentibacter salinarum]SKB51219.1 hypothetical protein SAMN05660903_01166 [Salegentibacter salinarum]